MLMHTSLLTECYSVLHNPHLLYANTNALFFLGSILNTLTHLMLMLVLPFLSHFSDWHNVLKLGYDVRNREFPQWMIKLQEVH